MLALGMAEWLLLNVDGAVVSSSLELFLLGCYFVSPNPKSICHVGLTF
jgi:hypothetical protein